MTKTITFRGITLVLEVEANPDPEENPPGTPFAFGVWEKMESEPESDEIVEHFGQEADAWQWINEVAANPEPYFRKRGII